MGPLDHLRRATFHSIAAQGDVRPTNRALRWMGHIARHGPQSSGYLYELTRATHRCKDTALRELQRLRAGGLLCLPPQQRQVARAEFNPYVYDLTERGKGCLRDHGHAVPPRPVSGHWQHQYLTASVTSAIDIAAVRDGVRYIPQHEILARKGATLGIPLNGRLLIPDQLFALDYGGSYRAFVLEVDRGTEPQTSRAARKSLESMLEAYQALLPQGALNAHYGLRASIALLIVVTRRSRAEQVRILARELGGAFADALLVRVAEPSAGRTMDDMLDGWQRADGTPFNLGRAIVPK
jgi:hypothetical protein